MQQIWLGYGYRTVVVAMITVWMMEVSIYDIINVIAVRYGFVSTAWTMNVVCIVSAAPMIWCAYIGIGFIDIQEMLIDMVAVWVVKVAVV